MRLKNLLLFGLIFLFIASCGKKEDEVIKIGVILPLTGSVSEPGNKSLNGLKLAISLYNTYETKHRIELIIEDSQSDPKVGVNAINKLINFDAVKVIIGDLMSSVAMAIAPIAQRNKVVLFAPGASNPLFTKEGNYIFRNWSSDNYDGIVMSNYILEIGLKRGSVIFINNDYGVGLAEAFKETFTKSGGDILFYEGYKQGTNDFRSILLKLARSKNLEFLYLVGQPQENGSLYKQLIEIGLKINIFANLSVESPDFIKIVKSLPVPITYSTPSYFPNKIIRDSLTFEMIYKEKYGTLPDVVAAHAFDAGNTTIQALKNSNFELDKFRTALSLIKNFEGVTGLTSFTSEGDVVKEVFIKEISSTAIQKIIRRYSPNNSQN